MGHPGRQKTDGGQSVRLHQLVLVLFSFGDIAHQQNDLVNATRRVLDR